MKDKRSIQKRRILAWLKANRYLEKGRKDRYHFWHGFSFALRWVLGEEVSGEISSLLPESKIVRPKRKPRGKLKS